MKMKQNQRSTIAIIVCMYTLLLVVASPAFASNQNSRGPQGGPPPEAIEACEGKNVGDTTSFAGRRGETLEATCQEVEGQLAAVPEGGPGRGPERE